MSSPQQKPASAEMQQFLVQQQAKAQLQQTISRLTDECWSKCIGNPGARAAAAAAAAQAGCDEHASRPTHLPSRATPAERCASPAMFPPDLPPQATTCLPRSRAAWTTARAASWSPRSLWCAAVFARCCAPLALLHAAAAAASCRCAFYAATVRRLVHEAPRPALQCWPLPPHPSLSTAPLPAPALQLHCTAIVLQLTATALQPPLQVKYFQAKANQGQQSDF